MLRVFTLNLLALTWLSLWTLPTTAQTSQELAAAEDVLRRAIEDHKVFLNCSAIDPGSYAIVVKQWQNMVDETKKLLAAKKFSEAFINDFAEKARIENLMMTRAVFSTVISFCNRDRNWQMKYSTFNYVVLPTKLEQALQRR